MKKLGSKFNNDTYILHDTEKYSLMFYYLSNPIYRMETTIISDLPFSGCMNEIRYFHECTLQILKHYKNVSFKINYI